MKVKNGGRMDTLNEKENLSVTKKKKRGEKDVLNREGGKTSGRSNRAKES